MKKVRITPMPRTQSYPYRRWAVTREDGWGRPITLFCEALRTAKDML